MCGSRYACALSFSSQLFPLVESSFSLSHLDSTRVLSILFHEDNLNLLPLPELDSHPLEEKHMQCSSERVFQKLSKAEQAKFLRL